MLAYITLFGADDEDAFVAHMIEMDRTLIKCAKRLEEANSGRRKDP